MLLNNKASSCTFYKKASTLFVLLFVSCSAWLFAQQGTITSGGIATGPGGKISFSIGQVSYITATGAGYSISQGLEQPCAIGVIATDICKGQTQIFSQSGGAAGGVWSVSGGGTINSSSGAFTATTEGGPFTATYSEPSPSICKGTATFFVKSIPSLTLGPDMYILYGALGYNGCRTISPNISGGVGPFTYLWQSTDIAANGSTNASVTVCNTIDTIHTYILTITAANGCTATDTVTLKFIDISCSNNPNNTKVTICHRPPGNPNNCKTICVSANAVQAFLDNGSYLGPCLPSCEIPVQGRNSFVADASNNAINGLNVMVMNNPSYSNFVLFIQSNLSERISMRVTDMSGRIIEIFDNINVTQTKEFGSAYKMGVYFAELRQGDRRQIIKLVKLK